MDAERGFRPLRSTVLEAEDEVPDAMSSFLALTTFFSLGFLSPELRSPFLRFRLFLSFFFFFLSFFPTERARSRASTAGSPRPAGRSSPRARRSLSSSSTGPTVTRLSIQPSSKSSDFLRRALTQWIKSSATRSPVQCASHR